MNNLQLNTKFAVEQKGKMLVEELACKKQRQKGKSEAKLITCFSKSRKT